MKNFDPYNVIVLGASSGGMEVVKSIVTVLPGDFSLPIVIVHHLPDSPNSGWADLLNERSQVKVKEADEKEKIEAGTVYLAPANYHLLVEADLTLTLTIDERVNYARPSIDVLFETAAESCRGELIGIVCTGANGDGAQGLRHIKQNGGLTIVQDPETAEAKSMPLAAIRIANPDFILSPKEILSLLLAIHKNRKNYEIH